MKLVLTANFQGHKKYPFGKIETELRAQIHNSLDIGWSPDDILLVTNFAYEFMNVRSHVIEMNTTCLTGSKTFVAQQLYATGVLKEDAWFHDLDLWQVTEFQVPEFKEVGISTYSRPKYNGGSLFYKVGALDIITTIWNTIIKNAERKEEPTINKVLKSDEYKDRVTVLNNRFNVGCSGFAERFNRSEKPVIGCHFHPTNRIAWDTHCRDRNRLGAVPVTERLYKLFIEHFGYIIKDFKYDESERGYPGNYKPPLKLAK